MREMIMYEWVSKYIYLQYAPYLPDPHPRKKRRGNLLRVLIQQTDLLDWKLIRDKDVFAK